MRRPRGRAVAIATAAIAVLLVMWAWDELVVAYHVRTLERESGALRHYILTRDDPIAERAVERSLESPDVRLGRRSFHLDRFPVCDVCHLSS